MMTDSAPPSANDTPAPDRTIQLVLHYDGAAFSGWQRQPDCVTVQGVLEDAIAKLTQRRVAVVGAGRTDAGVHARGQAASVKVPAKWTPQNLRKSLNATLGDGVWVAAAHEMTAAFHARYSALSRRYSYAIGLDDGANSPFRRRYEWFLRQELDRSVLDESARALTGEHSFLAFAVKGTAPPEDSHRCNILHAGWSERAGGRGGLIFEIEANRFLHHMVRFVVGTMVDAASGTRQRDAVPTLLRATDNSEVSAPAPPHALFLEQVRYPDELYLNFPQ